jgi:hypothetical protein
MPIDISKTLRQALATLESEQDRIERQVSAIRAVLGSADGRGPGRVRRRRRMSAAARRAVSHRMKAYWAARKARKGKAKKAAS